MSKLSFGCLCAVLAFVMAAAAQMQVPRFERGPCAVPVPETEKHVECGYLVVPENRSKKNNKTIRLPVAILKTDSPTPKPDPVLKTLGGPGGSSLRMIRGRSRSPWIKDRDYIIFEQRGTKYAEPALQCPEVDSAITDNAKKQLDYVAARKAEVAAARQCYDRLRAAGIDLDAYNSAESAADIDDLRKALGLKQINLWGVSYSARLMLDVMRYFPTGIRSVALESTLPPEVNYDEVGVDKVVRSLNEMFTACEADADCNAAYPDLKKELYAVIERLNTTPLKVDRADPRNKQAFQLVLTGNDFVTWIVDYLFSKDPSATVEAPYITHQAFLGNYAEQFKRDGGPSIGGSFYSWGMRYSVWCSEELPFEKMSVIKAQSSKYPSMKGYEVMALPDICSVWKVKKAKPIANTPVTSDIPTLVFGAQYDAYTDPEWGKTTASRLKNSFYFEVPWAGHGPAFSVPCVLMMARDFFDDPSHSPTSTCIEKTRSQFKFLVKKQ